MPSNMISNEVEYVWGGNMKHMHSVGFEHTSMNTFELETNSSDCSDKNDFILLAEDIL